jgi:outer membrane protein OmpA-like peptidoglycan-associated protein
VIGALLGLVCALTAAAQSPPSPPTAQLQERRENVKSGYTRCMAAAKSAPRDEARLSCLEALEAVQVFRGFLTGFPDWPGTPPLLDRLAIYDRVLNTALAQLRAPPPPRPQILPIQNEGSTLTIASLTGENRAVVHFNRRSARLDEDDRARLDEVSAALRADPSLTRLEISGFGVREGGSAMESALSQARAAEVKQYLVASGVDPARLSLRAYGEITPSLWQSSERPARSRRVEFKVLDVDPQLALELPAPVTVEEVPSLDDVEDPGSP